MDYSKTEINVSGFTVTKLDLYWKSTETHQYLHEQSCHRNAYKGSIIYGQVVRFKRICLIEET